MKARPRDQRIDVRAVPTWDRMRRVLSAFDDLAPDETLIVTTDHEARPLRSNLERLLPDRYVWRQRHVGSRHWEITLSHARRADDVTDVGAFFGRCAMLCDAAPTTRERFEREAIERTYAHDALIVACDEPWPYLGFVRTGALVMAIGTPNGRDHVLCDILAGDGFGATETLDEGRAVADIAAAGGPASVLLVDRAVALDAAATDAHFGRALAIRSAQQSRRIAERFTAYVAEHALDRVAATILAFASADAGLVAPLAPLDSMTQAELAARAGTAKEVAARAIATLESAGAIVRAKGHIALVDRHRLDDLMRRR